MRADPELERLLYRTTDNYIDKLQAVHLIHTGFKEMIEVEIRPYTLNQSFDGDELVHPTIQSIGRIQKRTGEDKFLALLQVKRTTTDPRDIEDINWYIDDPARVKQWLMKYQLISKPGLKPEPNRTQPADNTKHCWAWDHLHLINTQASSDVSEFTNWVNESIPSEIQQYYLGSEIITEEDAQKLGLGPDGNRHYWGYFSLTNISTDLAHGHTNFAPYFGRYLTLDAPTVIAMNWLLTGALRLNGIQVHAYHDDDQLGCLDVTDKSQVLLEQAQTELHNWLKMKWGDRLVTLLSRIKWSELPDIKFYEEIECEATPRYPIGLLQMPSVQWFLPQPSQMN